MPTRPNNVDWNVYSSADDALSVTPSDTVDLSKGISSGVYVGGSGDLNVTLRNGTTIKFVGLSAGIIHPIAAKRIHATGTTATNLIAVY